MHSCRAYFRWHSFRRSDFPLGHLPRHYRGVDFFGDAHQLPLRRAVWIEPSKPSGFPCFRHRPGHHHHPLQYPHNKGHPSGIVLLQLPSLPTIGEGYGTTSSTIGARMRKYSESVGRSYVASSVARWLKKIILKNRRKKIKTSYVDPWSYVASLVARWLHYLKTLNN